MYVVVEPRAQQSTAQHSSALKPARGTKKKVRADQSTYQKMYTRTCMLRPVCFRVVWSSWHFQVACLHLKCWTINLLHISAIPIHSYLRASVAGGTGRYAKRFVLSYIFLHLFIQEVSFNIYMAVLWPVSRSSYSHFVRYKTQDRVLSQMDQG